MNLANTGELIEETSGGYKQGQGSSRCPDQVRDRLLSGRSPVGRGLDARAALAECNRTEDYVQYGSNIFTYDLENE